MLSALKHWWLVFYLLILIFFIYFLLSPPDGFKEIKQPSSGQLRFDVTKAVQHIKEISKITEINGGRGAGTDGSLKTAAYIEEKFREAGIEHVESQEFQLGMASLKNVIAYLPGKTERKIVIAAHHDTAWQIPGIIDNASGVAVVLVLAELFSNRETNHTLILASFDGEEQGTLGSGYYVEQLSEEEKEKIDAMISVESVGWKDGDPVLHVFEYDRADRSGQKEIAPGWLVRSILNSGHSVGEDIHLGDKWISLFYQVTIRMGEVSFYSDEYPFVSNGIPGLFLSCFYLTNFYPQYHTGQDSLEQLGEDQLASAGKIVEGSFYSLDSLSQRPQDQPDYIFLFQRMLTGKEIKVLGFIILLLTVATSFTFFAQGMRFSFCLWPMIFAILFWYSLLLADTVVFFYYFLPASLVIPLMALRNRVLVSTLLLISLVIFIPLFTWVPYLFLRGFLRSFTLPLWQMILFFFLLLFYLFLFFMFMRKDKARPPAESPPRL